MDEADDLSRQLYCDCEDEYDGITDSDDSYEKMGEEMKKYLIGQMGGGISTSQSVEFDYYNSASG